MTSTNSNVCKTLVIIAASMVLLSACVSTTNESELNDGTVVQESSHVPSLPSTKNHYLATRKAFTPEQQAIFNRAMALTTSGDFDEALHQLETIHYSIDTPSAYWVLKGDIENKNGNSEGALQAYQTAVEHNHYNHFALNRLGALSRQQGDFAMANSYWNQALEAWPENPSVLLNLGILHDLYVGDKATALTHYKNYHAVLQEPSLNTDQRTLKRVQRWIKDVERQLSAHQQGGATSGK